MTLATLPPLAELNQMAVAWAEKRGIFEKSKPAAQQGKTDEEIREAEEALEYAEIPEWSATELGDILVTLCLQAHMQGTTLADCIKLAPVSRTPHTWQHRAIWATGLRTAISQYSPRIPAYIGALYGCVRDAAQTHLAMMPEECLALALAKISGRKGEMVNGVFVKAS